MNEKTLIQEVHKILEKLENQIKIARLSIEDLYYPWRGEKDEVGDNEKRMS